MKRKAIARLAAALFLGTASLPSSGCAAKLAAATLTVTEDDNGKPVALAIGQDVYVRLPAQLGTGFSWHVARDSASVLQLISSSSEGGAARPGVRETQVLRFRARKAGTGTLKILYSQAWDKQTPPAKTVTFSVRVAGR